MIEQEITNAMDALESGVGRIGQLSESNALDFMLAGNSTFTLVSQKSGERFTYKVKPSEQVKGAFFVSLLTGPNNVEDYRYLGMIFTYGRAPHVRLTKASRMSAESPAVKAITWTVARLALQLSTGVQIWHEGKCGCCGRALTVPESIASGIGPVCAQKRAA